MARGRELKVYLTSDVSKFGRGLKQAETRAQKFKKRMGMAFAGVAAAAGTAAVAFGVEGVKAAAEDEKASAKLAKTMENLGKAQDVDKAEDFIEALMKQTGVADDELRPAFEKLLLATGDTEDAMALLKTALDTSVGAGKPLETVATGIAKGMDGQVGALSRLIPGLDTAAAKADPLNSIMEQLNKRFSGQAATRAETYGGKMDAVGTAFGELQEAFGKGLLGNLEGTNDTMGGMDDTLYTLAPFMERLGAAIGGMASDAGALAANLGPVYDVLQKIDELRNAEGLIRILTLGNLGDVGYIAEGLDRLNNPGVEFAQPTSGVTTVGGGNLNTGQVSTNPFDLYRPMRFATRKGDAEVRGSARAAQREARTRSQP